MTDDGFDLFAPPGAAPPPPASPTQGNSSPSGDATAPSPPDMPAPMPHWREHEDEELAGISEALSVEANLPDVPDAPEPPVPIEATDHETLNLFGEDLFGEAAAAPQMGGTLGGRFIVPPFSVLDARQGAWQERKRAWIGLGIRSELGRGADLLMEGEAVTEPGLNYYRNRAKLDPERGLLDRSPQTNDISHYAKQRQAETAKEVSSFPRQGENDAYRARLRDEALAEEERQKLAALQAPGNVPENVTTKPVEAPIVTPVPVPEIVTVLTPVEPGYVVPRFGGTVWCKREDTFEVAGVRGGKVRTCWGLAKGATGLVTAGSRSSPQVNIVAHIARELGIPCRVHTPNGALSPEVEAAAACGAEVVQHKPGYNTVIVARAREDAAARGWREIPFGMECKEAVANASNQVANLPPDTTRVVVPVGSGMTLAGVLWGLERFRMLFKANPKVLGVVMGADPGKRLDTWGPKGWRNLLTLWLALKPSGWPYQSPAPETILVGGPATSLALDPIYEAKCIPFLRHGDVFWVVGIRQTATEGGTGKVLTPDEYSDIGDTT